MEEILKIVSQVSQIEMGKIQESTELRTLGFTSSIQLLKLQSAVERQLSKRLKPFRCEMRVGEIWGAEQTSSSFRTLPLPQTETALPLGVGVDLEEVSSLPETPNYRDHTFYGSEFTAEEISYALLQSRPRIHLCGMFAAKEAVRKSYPSLIELRNRDVQIIRDENGRPAVQLSVPSFAQTFQFQISISHTDHYAIAMVMCFTATK